MPFMCFYFFALLSWRGLPDLLSRVVHQAFAVNKNTYSYLLPDVLGKIFSVLPPGVIVAVDSVDVHYQVKEISLFLVLITDGY